MTLLDCPPKKNDSIVSAFQQVPQQDMFNWRRLEGCRNYDQSKGGSQVTRLKSDREIKTSDLNIGDSWSFPASNQQSDVIFFSPWPWLFSNFNLAFFIVTINIKKRKVPWAGVEPRTLQFWSPGWKSCVWSMYSAQPPPWTSQPEHWLSCYLSVIFFFSITFACNMIQGKLNADRKQKIHCDNTRIDLRQ